MVLWRLEALAKGEKKRQIETDRWMSICERKRGREIKIKKRKTGSLSGWSLKRDNFVSLPDGIELVFWANKEHGEQISPVLGFIGQVKGQVR